MSHRRACCCDCSICTGTTPQTWQVVFSSLTASGCQGDPDGGEPDAIGGCHVWLSQTASLTLPGTVCLRFAGQDGLTPGCVWCCTIPCEVNFRSEEGCAGDVLCTSTEEVYIELRLYNDGLTRMSLFAGTLSDNSYCRRGGYFSNNSFPLLLFSDTLTSPTNPCTDAQNFTNDITAASIENIAYGGTAVATPMACTPTSADCQLGDQADLCPTDCSGCDDSITVVLSGCPVGTSDGTYPCTRSGCVWTGTNGTDTVEIRCGTAGGGQPGIWTVTLGSAGDFPSFVASDHAECPADVVAWEGCGGCTGITVS